MNMCQLCRRVCHFDNYHIFVLLSVMKINFI